LPGYLCTVGGLSLVPILLARYLNPTALPGVEFRPLTRISKNNSNYCTLSLVYSRYYSRLTTSRHHSFIQLSLAAIALAQSLSEIHKMYTWFTIHAPRVAKGVPSPLNQISIGRTGFFRKVHKHFS